MPFTDFDQKKAVKQSSTFATFPYRFIYHKVNHREKEKRTPTLRLYSNTVCEH